MERTPEEIAWEEFVEDFGGNSKEFYDRWKQMFGRAPSEAIREQYHQLFLSLNPALQRDGDA